MVDFFFYNFGKEMNYFVFFGYCPIHLCVAGKLESLQEILYVFNIFHTKIGSINHVKPVKTLQMLLSELFPAFYDVLAKEEVLTLMVGLSTDPQPTVKHVHEQYKRMTVDDLRFGNVDRERLELLKDKGKTAYNATLFISLYGESSMELHGSWNHNEHWNNFGQTDHLYKTFTGRAPVYFPSRLYVFSSTHDDVFGEIAQRQQDGNAEIPECAMMIDFDTTDSTIIKKVMLLCRKISKRQAVTDLFIGRMSCNDSTEAEVPILRKNVQSVSVFDSKVSASFVRSILRQLFDCSALQTIDLHFMDLHEIETDLDQLLENLSSHCLKQKRELRFIVTMSMLSTNFCEKWAHRRKETGIIFGDKPKEEETSEEGSLNEITRMLLEQAQPQGHFLESSTGESPSSGNDDDNCSTDRDGCLKKRKCIIM